MKNKQWWVVRVPKGFNANKAYALCKKEFDCWSWYDDFDGIVEERVATKAYTVEFEPTIEAAEELKNLNANDIKEKYLQTITLTERLLLELQYFKTTGKHLDNYNLTLCAGSRYSDGLVPTCSWLPDDREFSVRRRGVGSSDDGLRARQVKVSTPFTSPPLTLRAKNGQFAKKTTTTISGVDYGYSQIPAEVEILDSIPTKIKYDGRVYVLEGE